MNAKRLSDLTGMKVENHPYDLGYWSRVAGLPRPLRAGQRRDGWDDANREIAVESKSAPGSEA